MANDNMLAYLPPLEVGGKMRVICPECEGGTSRERSMLVSRDRVRYSWHCFRANCGASGSELMVDHGAAEELAALPKAEPTRPYQGATRMLDADTYKRILDTYNVSAEDWRVTDDGRFLLPIYSPSGYVRGHVLRRPWWWEAEGFFDAPKTITYWTVAEPLLAWYIRRPKVRLHVPVRRKPILLVEDQLSAQRANQVLDVTTCALLGTGVNAEKIAEIQGVSLNVVIALDADATGQAFQIARKWGQAFKSFRVQVLPCDIKDMPLADLTNLRI